MTRRRARAGQPPRWLLVRPDGSIDGCHRYDPARWATPEIVWQNLVPDERQRDALIRHGWTIRRDDEQHTGFRALSSPVVALHAFR